MPNPFLCRFTFSPSERESCEGPRIQADLKEKETEVEGLRRSLAEQKAARAKLEVRALLPRPAPSHCSD